MRDLLRRVRGALGMGVTWALTWAVVGGGIMEGIVDPNGEILDMWPQTLAIPGFVFGIAFSVLLAVAARRRRFDELSLSRFAAWGAGTGLLMGGLALAAGALPALAPFWWRAAVLVAPVTLLSTISSTGALAVARLATRREGLPRGADDAALEPGPDAERRRLGGPG